MIKQLTENEFIAKNIVRLEEIYTLFKTPNGFVCEYVDNECNCSKTATYTVDSDSSFWCDEHMPIMKENKNYIQG
jgi:hypothetical protein